MQKLITKALADCKNIMSALGLIDRWQAPTVKITSEIEDDLYGYFCPDQWLVCVSPDDGNIEDTLRHELAHVLQMLLYPDSLDHGKEFRALALLLGAQPFSDGIKRKSKSYYVCKTTLQVMTDKEFKKNTLYQKLTLDM